MRQKKKSQSHTKLACDVESKQLEEKTSSIKF